VRSRFTVQTGGYGECQATRSLSVWFVRDSVYVVSGAEEHLPSFPSLDLGLYVGHVASWLFPRPSALRLERFLNLCGCNAVTAPLLPRRVALGPIAAMEPHE